MFKADYHVHTAFSCDSEVPMEEMIKTGINKGLTEIAFTDHVDFDPRYPFTNYNKYIPFIKELQEQYKDKINIVFGVEVGLENRWADKINPFITEFPFDFVIGSSHAVETLDVYFDQKKYFEGRTKEQAYTIYFEEMLKNIQTCEGFCVYGHLDFITRYGMYEDNSLKYADYSDLIDAVLKALIERGRGIEINTSGFKYGIANTYPSLDIVKRYKELGGEIITVGSDAHYTEYLADHIDFAYDILKKAGFDYVCTFREKKPIFNKLP